jgi:tetratricopeptide (TPR) repeat protein
MLKYDILLVLLTEYRTEYMRKNFTLLLLLSYIFVGYAQKDQIKEAQLQFKNGNSQGALSILKKTQYLINNAVADDKSEFFKLKAEIYKSLADQKVEPAANLSAAIAAYKELIAEEDRIETYKYSVKAREAIKLIKADVQNNAIKDVNSDNYVEAAKKMYVLYEIDKKDTINLYLSTSYYLKVKDYDSALINYKELNKLNYTGRGMEYYAVNKKTNVDELYFSITERDSYVKAGMAEKPRNVVAVSKRNEILLNMGFIYREKKDLAAAENCYKQLVAYDPTSVDGYLELAYLSLDKKKAIGEQMSVLGTSKAEMLTYDNLKIKMDDIVKGAIKYLEKANALQPSDKTVSDLLLKLYRSMDLIAEYNALKAKTN